MFSSIVSDVRNFFTRLLRNEPLSEVEHQQIHRIFSDTSPLGPVLFLLFALAGVVLWHYVPRIWLGLFIFGFISDVAVKIGIVEYYKRRTDAEQHSGSWRRVIFFGVMYTSGLWGASTLFLLYPMPVQNLVVGIGVFGIVLFIAITLARSYLPVQTVGACLSFLPMSVALMFSGVWQYQLLSVLLVFALCMMLLLFRNSAEVAVSQLREQARQDERGRIVRELHDGMGGHLMSAISLAEKQPGTPAVQQALRAALAEMRMLVNSADGEPQNLSLMMGELRSSIELQVVNAGLQLVWDVPTSVATPEIPVAAQLHVTRILQECVANVIKHANASTITVQIKTGEGDQGVVEICIIDDGVGLKQPIQTGGGLRNIRYRAEQISGYFTIAPYLPGKDLPGKEQNRKGTLAKLTLLP